MVSIPQLLGVIDAFAALAGRSPATVSRQALGGGARIRVLRSGGDIGIKSAERALQWLSDHWPSGAEWPADVPRPAPVGARSLASDVEGVTRVLS